MAKIMSDAGFDDLPAEMDISSRESVKKMIEEAKRHGDIATLANAAGVSPSQASIETILKVDLYGTAMPLEGAGHAIADSGMGATISSQCGTQNAGPCAGREPAARARQRKSRSSLACLRPANIRGIPRAYQMAKPCNAKRVMAESVKWGKRGERINSISPCIIVTPLAIDEFNGLGGAFYKNMFPKCPAGRPGTGNEVANVAELLAGPKGAFMAGSGFLTGGGATASYFYGPLKPQE